MPALILSFALAVLSFNDSLAFGNTILGWANFVVGVLFGYSATSQAWQLARRD